MRLLQEGLVRHTALPEMQNNVPSKSAAQINSMRKELIRSQFGLGSCALTVGLLWNLCKPTGRTGHMRKPLCLGGVAREPSVLSRWQPPCPRINNNKRFRMKLNHYFILHLEYKA
jgi:hypothetical protein